MRETSAAALRLVCDPAALHKIGKAAYYPLDLAFDPARGIGVGSIPVAKANERLAADIVIT